MEVTPEQIAEGWEIFDPAKHLKETSKVQEQARNEALRQKALENPKEFYSFDPASDRKIKAQIYRRS